MKTYHIYILIANLFLCTGYICFTLGGFWSGVGCDITAMLWIFAAVIIGQRTD